MPFVILNAISTRVATWKSALTALYSHRPQPTFFNPHFYGIGTLSTVSNKWTWRTYLSTSNKNTRCDRIALTTRFKLSSHIQYQPASHLSSCSRNVPSGAEKKEQRHGCFCRLMPSTPFGKFTFSLSTVKLRTREQTRIYSRKKNLSLLFSAYTCQWCGKRSAVDLG